MFPEAVGRFLGLSMVFGTIDKSTVHDLAKAVSSKVIMASKSIYTRGCIAVDESELSVKGCCSGKAQ
jgi:hypothetical protein